MCVGTPVGILHDVVSGFLSLAHIGNAVVFAGAVHLRVLAGDSLELLDCPVLNVEAVEQCLAVLAFRHFAAIKKFFVERAKFRCWVLGSDNLEV